MWALDVPLLLMEDNSRPIILFAGEESVTRGSTCTVIREGKSSNTESCTALWRKETVERTDTDDMTQELRLLLWRTDSGCNHLNLCGSLFGIGEAQSITAHTCLILQDKGTLGGGRDLTFWQAAKGQRGLLRGPVLYPFPGLYFSSQVHTAGLNAQFDFLLRSDFFAWLFTL